eukprot:gene976-2596_t
MEDLAQRSNLRSRTNPSGSQPRTWRLECGASRLLKRCVPDLAEMPAHMALEAVDVPSLVWEVCSDWKGLGSVFSIACLLALMSSLVVVVAFTWCPWPMSRATGLVCAVSLVAAGGLCLIHAEGLVEPGQASPALMWRCMSLLIFTGALFALYSYVVGHHCAMVYFRQVDDASQVILTAPCLMIAPCLASVLSAFVLGVCGATVLSVEGLGTWRSGNSSWTVLLNPAPVNTSMVLNSVVINQSFAAAPCVECSIKQLDTVISQLQTNTKEAPGDLAQIGFPSKNTHPINLFQPPHLANLLHIANALTTLWLLAMISDFSYMMIVQVVISWFRNGTEHASLCGARLTLQAAVYVCLCKGPDLVIGSLLTCITRYAYIPVGPLLQSCCRSSHMERPPGNFPHKKKAHYLAAVSFSSLACCLDTHQWWGSGVALQGVHCHVTLKYGGPIVPVICLTLLGQSSQHVSGVTFTNQWTLFLQGLECLARCLDRIWVVSSQQAYLLSMVAQVPLCTASQAQDRRLLEQPRWGRVALDYHVVRITLNTWKAGQSNQQELIQAGSLPPADICSNFEPGHQAHHVSVDQRDAQRSEAALLAVASGHFLQTGPVEQDLFYTATMGADVYCNMHV